MTSHARLLLASLLLVNALPAPAAADAVAIRERYTKHETMLRMRDGVRLFTTAYLPKDASPKKRYPILLIRTPYSVRPYGVDHYRDWVGPKEMLASADHIFVYQDVRGRYLSEGEFVNVRPLLTRAAPRGLGVGAPRSGRDQQIDESTDAYDTIDGLLRWLPYHNGRVGMMGISYPGFYAAAALIGAHPALRAVSPQAPVCDWFAGDDFHMNGVLQLAPAFNFISFFGKPRPHPTRKRPTGFEHEHQDGYAFFLELGPLANANTRHFKNEIAFWKDLMQHGTYDAFWQARDLARGLRAQSARPAVLTVGGWYDAENLFGTLRVFRAIEAGRPRGQTHLVLGPWSHGGWERSDGDRLGPVSFGAKTSHHYQKQVERAFFDQHLHGRGKSGLPKAYLFETGTSTWRRHDSWPPRGLKPRSYCFAPGGVLRAGSPVETSGFDEYPSDPSKPVPFVSTTQISMPVEYMVEDQRFATRRPDVLAYQSEVLEADRTLLGPVRVKLHVSTTGTDADFVVKLVDVYPAEYPDPRPNPKGIRMGGYQQLVRGWVVRAKFRNSLSRPEPLTPGKVTPVSLELPDVYHAFRRGHRIMVQVQSSWFPLLDRNPQTFVDIYRAKASDFRKAVHRIHRTRQHPSCLEALVLEGPR
jgi:putative CocE/NonD family hydrolase